MEVRAVGAFRAASRSVVLLVSPSTLLSDRSVLIGLDVLGGNVFCEPHAVRCLLEQPSIIVHLAGRDCEDHGLPPPTPNRKCCFNIGGKGEPGCGYL